MLNKEYIALQELVNDFQNNNEEFIKIIRSVGEEVLNVIPNVKVLLRYALLSITESIRNDPEKFRSIFNNISSMIDYNSNGQDYTVFVCTDGNNNKAHHRIIILKLMYL